MLSGCMPKNRRTVPMVYQCHLHGQPQRKCSKRSSDLALERTNRANCGPSPGVPQSDHGKILPSSFQQRHQKYPSWKPFSAVRALWLWRQTCDSTRCRVVGQPPAEKRASPAGWARDWLRRPQSGSYCTLLQSVEKNCIWGAHVVPSCCTGRQPGAGPLCVCDFAHRGPEAATKA